MFSRVTALYTKELVTKLDPKISLNIIRKNQFVNQSIVESYRSVLHSLQFHKIPPFATQRRTVFSMVSRPLIDKKLGHIGFSLPCFNIIARGTKTKKAAAKRFIVKGNGDLKYGRAGKRHNTSKKTKSVKRRLNQKGVLTGVWAKKMKEILAH